MRGHGEPEHENENDQHPQRRDRGQQGGAPALDHAHGQHNRAQALHRRRLMPLHRHSASGISALMEHPQGPIIRSDRITTAMALVEAF